MGRNVLVVSTVEEVGPALRRHVHDDDAVKLVVPAAGQGLLDWLANDERAFSQADAVADSMAERLPAEVVEAGPGEADIGLAIRDALATFAADEIVVAIERIDAGLESSLASETGTTGGRTIDGVPVRLVVIDRD